MNWNARAIVTLVAVSSLGATLTNRFYCNCLAQNKARYHEGASHRSLAETEKRRLQQQVDALRSFANAHAFNTRIAFLIDMALPSGKYRFFVADLRTDSVRFAGLVAHGSGGRSFATQPNFSNVNGSNCSSLGRYRIGAPYNGRFGRAYKLYGLDPTNDQAFGRSIVLHAYSAVPDRETDPAPICNSLGCPMVSPDFLARLEPLIDRSSRPIMLCIFN
jgi:hypothetical protein